MKAILIFLLLSFFYNSAYSQDPQLFDNDWYLHNLRIDNVENPIPINSELTSIPLIIHSDYFETKVCIWLQGDELLITNTDINVQTFYIGITDSCNLQENNDYENLYYNGFFQWQLLDRAFAYNIDSNGSNFSLILTNVNGDKAFYGNEPLGIDDSAITKFSIHPNPALNTIIITSAYKINTKLKIKIFTTDGKLINAQELEFEHKGSLNISDLSKGIYFLSMESENGNLEVRKFIKK